jgi:hypothetical protein
VKMEITYRIDSSCTAIAADIGLGFDELRQSIREGMDWFTHFWNVGVRESTRGRFVFRVSKPTKRVHQHAWAWQSGNTTNLNRSPISSSTGQVLRWNLGGLNFVGPHEVGHTLITRRHITNPPYYGDRSFGHVMAITSYAYQLAFSPLEIAYRRKQWGLRKDARHPFVAEWLAMNGLARRENKDKLLKIIVPYVELGLHAPVGVSEIDDYLKTIPRKPSPKVKF